VKGRQQLTTILYRLQKKKHRGLAVQLSGKYMFNLDIPPPQPLQTSLTGTGGIMNLQWAETGRRTVDGTHSAYSYCG
jgi:hypothetical protein